jgi:hypothetical protein
MRIMPETLARKFSRDPTYDRCSAEKNTCSQKIWNAMAEHWDWLICFQHFSVFVRCVRLSENKASKGAILARAAPS